MLVDARDLDGLNDLAMKETFSTRQQHENIDERFVATNILTAGIGVGLMERHTRSRRPPSQCCGASVVLI
jgi:hypothetical protein